MQTEQSNTASEPTVAAAGQRADADVLTSEQGNVITGYRAVVGRRRLGDEIEAPVFVRLRPKTDDVARRLVAAAWEIPATVGVYLVSVPVAGDGSTISAISLGAEPFVAGDAVEALLAAAVLPAAWRLVARVERTRER